jgi:hypothetical protein
MSSQNVVPPAPYCGDLERIYASSDFCIVPLGDCFSSRRTFDAMRMVRLHKLNPVVTHRFKTAWFQPLKPVI